MIGIPQSLEKRLARLAKRSGRNIDELAHEAILQYVEDSEDADAAERILRRVRSGREKTYTLEHVAKRLGLEH
jgi:RHH-type transcriptional regulator, rel operon repressor / antitoxin RelB